MDATASERPVAEPPAYVLDRLPSGTHGDVRWVNARWITVRFADGRIHQPATERYDYVSLRLLDHGRLGVATSSRTSRDGLDALVRAAAAMARAAPPEAGFPGFVGKGRAVRPVAYSRATAELGVEDACRAAREAIAAAEAGAPGARITGVLNVGSETLSVRSDAGADAATRRSAAQASVLVEGRDREVPVSGWSDGAHWDLRRLDVGRIGREAAERMPTRPPEPMAPGKYRVVLRTPAVAEMVSFLGHLGFGAVPESEGSSCLGRVRGRTVFPSHVTLTDDGRSPASLPASIDYEGTPKRPVRLIDHGRVGPPVTDRLMGGRLGRPSSGHGFPPESPWGEVGPFPAHLLLAAGASTEEELVKEVGHGLLVTRFHYVRTVDPATGAITGMTRDGTYRIERGEIAAPVRNLRFTDSIVSVLKRTSALGRSRRTHSTERGSASQTVPALASGAFRLTSATDF